MPEINPLTNDQIFLKKIAENTGSDYETGDVSEINPLTIDQIFLKEIAANTAGQSGDITELEGKVADNTSAIEAIVNEYGAKNIASNDATTKTDSGVLFTVNADKSVTVQRQTSTTDPYSYIKLFDDKTLPAIPLILSGCPNVTGLTLYLYDKTTSTRYNQTGDEIEVTPVAGHIYSFVIEALNSADLDTAVTVYPMIRDARITDPTYVPYAMTNMELTERVSALPNMNLVNAPTTDYDDLPTGVVVMGPNGQHAPAIDACLVFTSRGDGFGIQYVLNYNGSHFYTRVNWGNNWEAWNTVY